MRHPFPGRVEMTIQVLLDDRFELIQQIRLKVAHCRSVTYASVGYATVGTGTQRRRGRATATVIQWRSRADQAPLSMAPARRPSAACHRRWRWRSGCQPDVGNPGAPAASPLSVALARRSSTAVSGAGPPTKPAVSGAGAPATSPLSVAVALRPRARC